MKRLAILGIFAVSALQALPLVNPADSVMYTNGICWHQGENSCCFPSCDYDCWLDRFSMRFGFSGDYVFDRNVEVKHALVGAAGSLFPEGGDFMTTTIMTNAGTFCVNYADWIEAYVGFGVTNFSIRTSSSVFSDATPVMASHDFNPTVSYLVGAAAPIWQKGNFILGVQAQYFYAYPNANHFVRQNDGRLHYSAHSDRAKYVEYQGAIAVSYNFEYEFFSIVPFGGIQFSGLSWNLSSINNRLIDASTYFFPKAHEQQVVGWTIGTSMYLCNRGGVTIEGRFANEKALNVSGQLVF